MNFIFKFLNNKELLLLIALLVVLFSSTLAIYSVAGFQNAYADLAWAFLHGKLHFLYEFANPDLIILNNHSYWHMPPFPAIVLMPALALINAASDQNLLNLFFNILLFFFIVEFTRKKFGFSKLNSCWLALLFVFSSIYVNAIYFPLAYNYAQTIATFLILFCFNEYFGKKRYALIGVFIGLIFLSRLTAGLVIIFFLLDIITEKAEWRQKIKSLIWLSIPVIACLLLFGLYNYARFNNPLETGYTLNNSYNTYQEFHPYGQFSYKYIPSNFYYYFLEGLTPNLSPVTSGTPKYQLAFPYITINVFGSISFFIISPLFLLLFKANYRDRTNRLLLITAMVITLTLLSYYFNGWSQIGPRYFLDCFPLLFIILLSKLKTGLTIKHKAVIVASSLLNLFLAISLIYLYLDNYYHLNK